jgi:cell division protein FtsI/penicillin-binding protein 2
VDATTARPGYAATVASTPAGGASTPGVRFKPDGRHATDAVPAPAATDAAPLPLRRVWLVVALFVIIVLAIIARMSYWALADDSNRRPRPGAAVGDAATGERLRSRIVDRNGLLLATDSFSWEAYARPQGIQKDTKDGAANLTSQIAQILGQPVETIQAGLAVTASLVTLAKNLDATQQEKLAALDRPSLVWTEDRRVRAYPLGQLGTHLIGFTDYHRDGLFGVEASYNGWLLGQKDLPPIGTDDARPEIGKPGRGEKSWTPRPPESSEALPEEWRLYLPSPGRHDVILAMDAPLQHLVETHLADAVSVHRAEGGTIIVMDPRDGSILALANFPTFDPGRYSDVSAEWWANAATSKSYEPGSVFKLVTMAAALDTGQITPQQMYNDTGVLMVDGQPIRNAENKNYGMVPVQYALAKSINVITARICLDMGAETFYRYVRQFGFGSLTEVDLSPETIGFLKEPGNPFWSRFDQATNSFGQALLVTPMQMINAVAAIANGGTRYQPQAVRALVQDGRVHRLPARVLGYPIKPETAKTLTQMMVYNIESATYRGLVPGFKVAGKTGTAEISTARGYTSQDTITSFVGFLPAADPQVIILVKLDKPKSSRWAEQVVVPVFGKVAQDAVRVLQIAPDAREP